MDNVQFTELAVIVIALCITAIAAMLIFKAKDRLKFKVDKSGIELELTDGEENVNNIIETQLPEQKEISNETDIA
jgi:hypothetical protein